MAELKVTGTGACGGWAVVNFGYCEPLLLMSSTAGADFSHWIMSDSDPVFETDPRSSSQIELTGPLLNAPASLKPGTWSFGLGVRSATDLPSEGPGLDVLCFRSVTVAQGTQRVDVVAHFEQHCSIEVLLDGLPVPIACNDTTLYWLADSGRDQIDIQTYPDATVVTITVTAVDDPNFAETAAVESTDSACIGHRLIGPILRGILDGYEPESTKSADLVGRLMVIDTNAGCAVLLDRDGLTWDPIWPAGYSITERGVLGTDGRLVAENGALVGLTGRDASQDLRACLVGTGFQVDGIAFVEPPPAN